MCGVVGIVAKSPVNQDIYDALIMLQHRGQDAAGIATSDGEQLYMRKSNGLVRDVIRQEHMLRLQGNIGMGHVRYPTAGCSSEAEAQPFYVNSPYGIALAHNGNLVNAAELKKDLWESDRRHLNTSSDSEVIVNILAHELQSIPDHQLRPGTQLTPQQIFTAVAGVNERCQGAYAVIAMIIGYGIVAFRDPHGIRPLCYGKRDSEQGAEYMLASESVALDVAGFKLMADVAPGECVIITHEGEVHRQHCADKVSYSPCIFEHVYLARPDSIIDKILVYKMRLKLGEYLAEKLKKQWPDHDIDVVIPIPDTSRVAAHAMARHLCLKYREGFVKNHYIGRTFIMPGQSVRRKSVRQKLNAISLEFKNKNVLLVDDSIVRGTTSKEIIAMAREAGAAKVYFASAAPEVRYPNVYGIDMPSAQELIAHDCDVDEIAQRIGADGLIFQDHADLIAAAREGNPDISRFEDCVFTGDYIAGNIDTKYLASLDAHRNDGAKQDREMGNDPSLRVDFPHDS